MKYSEIISFFKKPLVASFVAFIVLLTIVSAFTFQRWHNYTTEQTILLQRAAYSAKERLEKLLEYSLSATQTLSIVVSNYNFEKDFNEVAKNIMANNQYVDALQLAKGGVVTHVYPYNENISAIGLNVLDDSMQKAEAEKAIRNNEMYFAGPLKLKQGYTGVIGRMPIFINKKFWGFSTVIIKLSTLTRIAQMDSSFNSAYLFQLSKINPNTGNEEFFLPHPERFNSKNAVAVYEPRGDWKIYARFVKPQKRPNNIVSLFLFGLLLSFSGGLVVWFITRQPLLLTQMVNQKTSQLMQSEEKFRILVEQNLVAVFILQDEKFVYSNPGFEELFGYTYEEMLSGLRIKDIVYQEDLQKVRQYYDQQVTGKKSALQYNIRVLHKSGQIRHAEVIASPIMFENKPAFIGTAIDITNRVEEEKKISKAVTDAQERERLQIGMELHDNVKQILAATLLNLEFLNMHLDNKEMASDRISRLISYMNEAIYELRRLSHQLAPSLESSVNLYDKIDSLVKSMFPTDKLKVNIEVELSVNELSSDLQLAIYRILQEQLANILKHADATLLLIVVKREGKFLDVIIKDNGKGFDPVLVKQGIGLENIQRRAQAHDGLVVINSAPGKGVELIVKIPFGAV